jgi:RNA-directed DNA polymerase
VARFALDLEKELFRLQRELRDDRYQPGAYRLFRIYERKPRIIAAAPFRDRVVHHAVMNLIEPPLDRTFIHDAYACRRGKGVHAAVDRYQGWARRNAYALKMDVAQYFPSVDHQILKEKLRRRIKDARLLALLDRIVDTSPQLEPDPGYFPGDDLLTPLERWRGIPIGNLTSQFLANLYLDDLDHYAKQVLKVSAYLRYVDDMVALDDDKGRLAAVRAAVGERRATDRLRLHPRKAHVSPPADGLDLLGYLVFPNHRRLRNDNGHRFSQRMHGFARAYAAGLIDLDAIKPSLQSWIGHALHADTLRLRARILSRIVFRRGTGREAAGARGLLEQQTGEPPLGQPQQEQRRQPEQQHQFPPRPIHPHGLDAGARSRAVQGQTGCGARVSMSPLPGLAWMGAPNSTPTTADGGAGRQRPKAPRVIPKQADISWRTSGLRELADPSLAGFRCLIWVACCI